MQQRQSPGKNVYVSYVGNAARCQSGGAMVGIIIFFCFLAEFA
jgi:hypothetical protein